MMIRDGLPDVGRLVAWRRSGPWEYRHFGSIDRRGTTTQHYVWVGTNGAEMAVRDDDEWEYTT